MKRRRNENAALERLEEVEMNERKLIIADLERLEEA